MAGIAAAAGVVAASSCCLPIFPFLAAAGFAGGSAFLNTLRPYLLGASVLFIAFGFYQARRARQCSRAPSLIHFGVLWLSAAFVAASIFFPQAMANTAANLLSRAPAGPPAASRLTAQPIAGIGDAFNAAKNQARVVVFLSPT